MNPEGSADTVEVPEPEAAAEGRMSVEFTRDGFQGFMYFHQPYGPQWLRGMKIRA